MHTRSTLLGTLVLAGTIACGRSEQPSAASTPPQDSAATRAAAAGAASVAAGEPVVIRTTSNAVDLGLANDTVYMALSDSMLKHVRAEMTKDGSDTSDDFAGRLSTVIKRGVSHALATRIDYPITDINSARYEDGTIKFDYRHKHAMSFENVSIDKGGTALSHFAPADAERFVAAVNTAIHTVHPAQ